MGHAMGGGMGGGARFGGMGGGMRFGAVGAGPRFGGVGPHFSGARFASAPFASRAAFAPRHVAFRNSFHHRFVHNRFNRFNRFAFIGAPFAYAYYDSCWRRVWTPYGLQLVNVCGDYYY